MEEWAGGRGEEEEDGQIKVDFYSSHIGHAGCGLIYGEILPPFARF